MCSKKCEIPPISFASYLEPVPTSTSTVAVCVAGMGIVTTRKPEGNVWVEWIRFIVWCRREGSNLRPKRYECFALTTELRRQKYQHRTRFPLFFQRSRLALPSFCWYIHRALISRGGEVVSRQAHNLEVAGSNPAPATSKRSIEKTNGRLRSAPKGYKRNASEGDAVPSASRRRVQDKGNGPFGSFSFCWFVEGAGFEGRTDAP